MATWQDLSLDNLRAAKLLVTDERFRSSISRAYYAAYCAVTSELVDLGIVFAHGWHNPAHEQVVAMVEHNLSLSTSSRRSLMKSLRLLRAAREDADYRPAIAVGRSLALACIRDAGSVARILEIEEDD